MPRIRTIKPEIWDSPDFMELPAGGQLTFIALISLADDHGRLRGDARHLHLVALRAVDVDEITGHLTLMERLGMIHRYTVDERAYIQLQNWTKHQRVDHAKPALYPPPPIENPRERSRRVAKRRDGSSGSSGIGRDESRSVEPSRAPADQGSRIKERTKDQGSEQTKEEESEKKPDPVDMVFEAWMDSLPEGVRREFTSQRRSAIRGGLARAPVEDCLDAVKGWRWDTWEGRLQNNDLEDCLRPSNIERFRDWERGINRPHKSLNGQTQQTAAAEQAWRWEAMADAAEETKYS